MEFELYEMLWSEVRLVLFSSGPFEQPAEVQLRRGFSLPVRVIRPDLFAAEED